jgi:Na+-transporting methylmalonyl-CoA/oxaloacetate decarboxylase gamma subunit
MSEEIEFGLTIMAVGMITVFSILGFVVLGGKAMIIVINKFTEDVVSPPSSGKFANHQIDNTKISVLASAVSAITKGKGKITNIKKL